MAHSRLPQLERPIVITLLALPESDPPTLRELHEHLTERFGEAAQVAINLGQGVVEMTIGEDSVLVSSSTDPIPPDVYESPCRTAWYWPEAGEVFSAHRSHLAIIVRSEKTSAKLLSMLMTRVAADLSSVFEATGLYWEPAAMVHATKAFCESAEEMSEKQVPLRLWVRFQLIENDDATHSLFTQGLEPLGFLEVEIRQSRKPPENIYGWAFNIAHFMIERGELVDDGHTVGVSQTEWIRVHHMASALDEERTVLFLDLDLDEELSAAQEAE